MFFKVRKIFLRHSLLDVVLVLVDYLSGEVVKCKYAGRDKVSMCVRQETNQCGVCISSTEPCAL